MISKFFIERPVLANVIAVLMVLIGLVALIDLPIAQYPNVVPPTVQVTTRYPGASARTVMDTVALPIEQQVNGVQNMLYMQIHQRERRQLHADRHIPDRHGPQLRAGSRAEPRLLRAVLTAAGGAGAGRDGAAEIDRRSSKSWRSPRLTAATTACTSPTTPRSISSRRSRACRASAMSTCSARASIPCASGWIRTSCRRAASCRRT